MSVDVGQAWTYEKYAALPDDGKRYEVVDGELFVPPSPNIRHQDLVLSLAVRLVAHVRDHGVGRVFVAPLDTVLSDTNIVQPDVLFVADAVRDRITEANLQGAPSLAVEVLSNPRHDRVRKRRLYAQFGVEEYWIVDPEAERVEVHRLAGTAYPAPTLYEAGTTLATDLLPGLAIDVAELFSAPE